MDDKIYSISLEDGTVLSGLRLNGNNYISDVKITEDVFENNLGTITISDGETSTNYTDLELVQLKQYGDEYWFILREIPESEMFLSKLRADLDYTMMMEELD